MPQFSRRGERFVFRFLRMQADSFLSQTSTDQLDAEAEALVMSSLHEAGAPPLDPCTAALVLGRPVQEGHLFLAFPARSLVDPFRLLRTGYSAMRPLPPVRSLLGTANPAARARTSNCRCQRRATTPASAKTATAGRAAALAASVRLGATGSAPVLLLVRFLPPCFRGRCC